VCHASEPPLTVSQVHHQKSDLLEELVHELWPVYVNLTTSTIASNSKNNDGIILASNKEEEEEDDENDIASVLTYMKRYSMSMPNALPSRDLALAELADRNAVFYREGQTCHKDLLWKQIQREEKSSMQTNKISSSLEEEILLQKWLQGTK
jgi:hypothetical protein